jgi:hypothetical protein
MSTGARTLALALTLAGARAEAQIAAPIRTVGSGMAPVNAVRPLGRLDCENGEEVSL